MYEFHHSGVYNFKNCTWMSEWNAYQCDDSVKYAMLSIESMDQDTETRRLSPVAVFSGGYIDLLNGPQDHGWCSGYTCRKRLSTFPAIVPLGRCLGWMCGDGEGGRGIGRGMVGCVASTCSTDHRTTACARLTPAGRGCLLSPLLCLWVGVWGGCIAMGRFGGGGGGEKEEGGGWWCVWRRPAQWST